MVKENFSDLKGSGRREQFHSGKVKNKLEIVKTCVQIGVQDKVSITFSGYRLMYNTKISFNRRTS